MKMTPREFDEKVFLPTFNNAVRLGKFRTFAAIVRKSVDPYFSAEMNREVMRDMSFLEWAAGAISDGSPSFRCTEDERVLFQKLAKEKGILAIND